MRISLHFLIENLSSLLDSSGGSHVINVSAFDKEDFTSWKVRFLVFLDGLEPYLLKTLEDGPFVPMSETRKNEKGNSEKGLITKSFDWDEESVSSKDKGTTKIRAFMAIAEDEPSVEKADARSSQSFNITMKNLHRLLSITDGDEKKHVLDYTYVDLHYVKDKQEKDKIRSKPDKNGKRGEAGKSQKAVTVKRARKTEENAS
uniref:Uncharacterized protein n=1 Tax=Tanacetum cinerariifolium TaxID=118510 RepID=A0A6L2KIN1_TANCI|nr:hypothetical protein [Tanacetum cinerariifolium]